MNLKKSIIIILTIIFLTNTIHIHNYQQHHAYMHPYDFYSENKNDDCSKSTELDDLLPGQILIDNNLKKLFKIE